MVLALAALTQGHPLNANTTESNALEARQLAPPGIHIWGHSHPDCQGTPGEAPTFHLALNVPISVKTPFTTYALDRPLTENEHIEFYTANKNSWTGEPEGDWCAVSVGSADWTAHKAQCDQVSEDSATGDLVEANCIKWVN